MAKRGGTFSDQVFVNLLAREVRAGNDLVLCSLLSTRGSMPRGAGARMAMRADGSFVGTIGGGRIELMGQARCRAMMEGDACGSFEWLTQEQTGMACGGDALVAVRRLDTSDLPVLEAIATLGAQHVWLVEDWRDPAHPYVRLADDPATLPAAVVARDLPCWDEGLRCYVEPLGVPQVAYVFGVGHVGAALVPLLASVGFRVVALDDRPGMATGERLSQAYEVHTGPYRQLAKKVPVTSRDFVVVLTHGHEADTDVLECMLPKRPAYVGCIGSRNKASAARAELVRRGQSPELVEAIHMPIGERIGARTPEEIAVSIAAEMIRCRAELQRV